MTTAPDLSPRPPLRTEQLSARGVSKRRSDTAWRCQSAICRATTWATTWVAPTKRRWRNNGRVHRVAKWTPFSRLAVRAKPAGPGGPPLARQEARDGGSLPPNCAFCTSRLRPVAERSGFFRGYRSHGCPGIRPGGLAGHHAIPIWPLRRFAEKQPPRRLSGALLFRPFSWAMQEKGQGNRGR